MPPVQPTSLQGSPRLAPGQIIQAQPWAFVVLALTVGMTAGLLLRVKPLRKALSLYLTVRRFV